MHEMRNDASAYLATDDLGKENAEILTLWVQLLHRSLNLIVRYIYTVYTGIYVRYIYIYVVRYDKIHDRKSAQETLFPLFISFKTNYLGIRCYIINLFDTLA